MEKQHILLKNVDFRKVRDFVIPSGFNYRVELGAWTDTSNGNLLFEHPEFSGVASKKKDIEIGEDQK